MICLGIESTAHTFGVGIITEKGKVLANVKDAYTTDKGGIHPSEAKIHHQKVSDDVIASAIKTADISEKEIDMISFSQDPGLAPCLIVGMNKSKELAVRLNKKL